MSVKKRVKAIDRFIAGCKTDGIYDDLNAACIMAGWDGLAGALTPLKGTAPTNSGFLDTDYDRGGIGIAGDETSYINSGFATNQLTAQDDFHLAIFPTTENSVATTTYHVIGSGGDVYLRDNVTNQAVRPNTTEAPSSSGRAQAGKILAGSLFGTTLSYRINGVSQTTTGTAKAASGTTASVFGTAGLYVNESLAFYSFGSATDLALLDARVSTLMSDLRSIEESDFDADALTYIRAVEEADGAYLETDVKVAINKLVAGLKFDSLWDSIGTSCLLCGPRTIAGALVPLREYGPELWDAPTPTIATAAGASPGSWDAASQTMSCPLGTTANYPRFGFYLGLVAGSQYVVSGRLTGDTASVTTARLCIAVCGDPTTISYDPSTGLLSGTVTAGGTSPPALELGLDASLGPASVTIESLSIREVIAAPTAEGGWASDDYDRSTGLKGDGNSLYLDTGVNNSSFTQDDFHMACYVTEAGTAGATRWLAGAGLNQTGASEIFTAGNNYQYRNQSGIAGTSSGFADTLTGLMASSRYEDEFFDFRAGSLSSSSARVSQSLFSGIIHIFKTSEVAATSGFNGRLAYYSLGSQVDMAKLRTHLDAYVTAIGAAL